MAKILVVEDAPSTLGGLLAILKHHGYDAVGAQSLEEGRRMADEQDADLLVIDVRLGAYNGMQLLVRERLSRRHRPVILTTGYPDALLEAEARGYGAEFLVKPYAPSELLELIQRMLSPQTA